MTFYVMLGQVRSVRLVRSDLDMLGQVR